MDLLQNVEGVDLLKVENTDPWKSLNADCVKVEVYLTVERGGPFERSASYVGQYLPRGKDSLLDLRGRAYKYTEFVNWTRASAATVAELKRVCRDPEYNPTSTNRAGYVAKLLGSLYCFWH